MRDYLAYVKETFSDEMPDYKTAMEMFQKYDILSALPDEKVDGSVKYLSDKRGYSRKTIQRAQKMDPALKYAIKQADLNNYSCFSRIKMS